MLSISRFFYPAPDINTKSISFRKIKDINVGNFAHYISKLEIFSNFEKNDNIDNLVDQYNSALSNLLNVHAPVIHKHITTQPHAPWHHNGLLVARRSYRKAERRYRTTGFDDDKRAFKSKHNNHTRDKDNAKKVHYIGKIDNSKGDSAKLFKVANQLLHRKKTNPLPPHSDPKELCNEFASFFKNKVDKIRDSFDNLDIEKACSIDVKPDIPSFQCFRLKKSKH